MHQVSFIRPCILTFTPFCVLRVYFISSFHPVQQIQCVTSIQRMPNLGRPHQYPWEKIGEEVIIWGHDLFTFFEI